MRESDRVRHILKGIADTAFNVFLVQNPTSVSDITSVCQHLDEMRTVRLPHRPQVDKNPPTTSELRQMIREIVREEMKKTEPRYTCHERPWRPLNRPTRTRPGRISLCCFHRTSTCGTKATNIR
ncbi:unnamed protein product [Ixodes persulcatus]